MGITVSTGAEDHAFGRDRWGSPGSLPAITRPPRTRARADSRCCARGSIRRGSLSRTAKSARPPTSSVVSGGHRASGASPSATTLAPPRSMMCESPRDVPRTSSSLPSAITVSSAQARADTSGSSRPEMTIPPIRSVYRCVTLRGYAGHQLLMAPRQPCADDACWNAAGASPPLQDVSSGAAGSSAGDRGLPTFAPPGRRRDHQRG
jgi:hypothetical protein